MENNECIYFLNQMLILIHTMKTEQGFVHCISSNKKYIKTAQLIITYDRFDTHIIVTQLKKYLLRNGISPITQIGDYDILSNEIVRTPRRNRYLGDPEIFYELVIKFANSYGFIIETLPED